MIRKMHENDLEWVGKTWLETNISAHDFIPAQYWIDNLEVVKGMLLDAEIYVYQAESPEEIYGFVGLIDDYIAGIFVMQKFQSDGVGKQLLDYAKTSRAQLSLSVYCKNERAVRFYQRENFVVKSESVDENTNEMEFNMVWTKYSHKLQS